jgi:2-methylcitrate dehydratase PrpD
MIARSLATWATGPLDIPDEVRAAARRHLLDGVGTALGALRTRAAEPAVAVARGLGGPGEAVILGDRRPIGAPAAALANGTLVHALDFDDTHAGGLIHGPAVVLPAALAIGQQLGASGAAVLEAAIVGYETACRVTAAAPNGFHARGLHATMIGGVFSSAIVAARLLGLDADRATDALGIAGSQAGGLLAFLGTGASTKQLHPGFASQAGIIAARLAAAGASGPGTVFDGPHGVFDALASGPVDLASITADLGGRWETTRIGIKPYAACQLSHATVDAVRDAMASGGFVAADVADVLASVHPDSATVVCDERRDLSRPSTPYAAKFSLPWTVAAVLYDGDLTLDSFSDDSLTRPELGELARRVRWTPLPAPATVAADAPGRVLVTLRDGREITGAVPRSRGGGAFPLSDRELLAKFHGNAGGDPALADAVADSLTTLAADDGPGRLLEAVARVADQYRSNPSPADRPPAPIAGDAGPDLETQR